MTSLRAWLLGLFFLVVAQICIAENSKEEAQITKTQNTLSVLIPSLTRRQGSHQAVTEYRIASMTQSVQPLFSDLMKEKEAHLDFLVSSLNKQLKQVQAMSAYFDKKFSQMEFEAGNTTKDPMPLLTMVKTENQNDVFIVIEDQTLSWLKELQQAGADKQQADFIEKMKDRAELIIGYLEYSKQSVDDFYSISKVKSPEQSSTIDRGKLLRQRLKLTENSLSTVIDILDRHGVDATKYKEALFYASGEVTPDVFDKKVLGSLIKKWLASVKTFFLTHAVEIITKVLVFVLIILGSVALSYAVKKLVGKTLNNNRMQLSRLKKDFILGMLGKFILVIGFLVALSQMGINLGPVLAGLGVAGVVIGFALKETLSNIASGILIIIYRPFDIGDLITAVDVTGVVTTMTLVSTTINTFDNQRLIIPNTKIWEDKIDNLTAEKERRVDMIFSIHYQADLVKAEAVLRDIIESHSKILPLPDPMIKVDCLNDSSVDIAVKSWVRSEDYWQVYWDLNRTVKLRFDEENIVIPFPQLDVHTYSKAL